MIVVDVRSHTKLERIMESRIRQGSPRSILDIVSSVVVIIAAATLMYKITLGAPGGARVEIQVPSEPVSIEGAPIRGSRDADVAMIVYSDFQCPFCARFTRETMPEIERRYVVTGKVALAFRHLPLPIHPHAIQAAVAAECAAQQGQFWQMHDLLFSLPTLDADSLVAVPDSMDVDRSQFDECLADPALGERVQASAKEANALGIRSTPAFFFGRHLGNGRVDVSGVLSGARPADAFIEQLDAALAGGRSTWRRWFPFLTSQTWSISGQRVITG